MTVTQSEIAPTTAAQIAALALHRARALIVCDADEVLLAFMAGLEAYLRHRELYHDWSSYRLDGNIRCIGDDRALEGASLRAVLDDFHLHHADELAALPGAAAALSALAARAEIVILTNIAPARRARRAGILARHGMPYPVITNDGTKGAAVGRLARLVDGPVVFIDDHPGHHAAVAVSAPATLRLHFVAHARLGRLLGPAPESHHRIADWGEALRLIDAHLAAHGH